MINRMKRSIDLWKMAVGYVLLTATFASVEFTALTYLPLSSWIKYEAVTVFRPVPAGGPIEALSILERRKPVDMIYNDTLFCANNLASDFRLYSIQKGEYKNAPVTKKDHISKWTYTSPVPNNKSICYIRSAVTVQHKYGIRPKPQILQTSTFIVGQ